MLLADKLAVADMAVVVAVALALVLMMQLIPYKVDQEVLAVVAALAESINLVKHLQEAEIPSAVAVALVVDPRMVLLLQVELI
jgi:hypothetical protein